VVPSVLKSDPVLQAAADDGRGAAAPCRGAKKLVYIYQRAAAGTRWTAPPIRRRRPRSPSSSTPSSFSLQPGELRHSPAFRLGARSNHDHALLQLRSSRLT